MSHSYRAPCYADPASGCRRTPSSYDPCPSVPHVECSNKAIATASVNHIRRQLVDGKATDTMARTTELSEFLATVEIGKEAQKKK